MPTSLNKSTMVLTGLAVSSLQLLLSGHSSAWAAKVHGTVSTMDMLSTWRELTRTFLPQVAQTAPHQNVTVVAFGVHRLMQSPLTRLWMWTSMSHAHYGEFIRTTRHEIRDRSRGNLRIKQDHSTRLLNSECNRLHGDPSSFKKKSPASAKDSAFNGEAKRFFLRACCCTHSGVLGRSGGLEACTGTEGLKLLPLLGLGFRIQGLLHFALASMLRQLSGHGVAPVDEARTPHGKDL